MFWVWGRELLGEFGGSCVDAIKMQSQLNAEVQGFQGRRSLVFVVWACLGALENWMGVRVLWGYCGALGVLLGVRVHRAIALSSSPVPWRRNFIPRTAVQVQENIQGP